MEEEIVAKENWYKMKDDEDDDVESPSKYIKTNDRLRANPDPTRRLPPRSARRSKNNKKDKHIEQQSRQDSTREGEQIKRYYW